jgi:hypothetical protein
MNPFQRYLADDYAIRCQCNICTSNNATFRQTTAWHPALERAIMPYSQAPPAKAGGLWPDSTAIRHTW